MSKETKEKKNENKTEKKDTNKTDKKPNKKVDKKSNKKVSKKDDLTNVIIIVTTAVIIVAIIVLTVLYYISNPTQNTDEATVIPQTSHTPTPTEMIKTYDDVTESGTVSKADSKVYNYFMSHYQDDYYLVNEVEYSIVDKVSGQYSEYYETHTRAYSADGYLYSDKKLSSYEEKDYTSSSEVTLRTPDKNYILYPDFKEYMEYPAGEPYTNTVNFPVDEFKTGTIKINGRDYYYESYSDEKGITYRYCFDDSGELKFDIATSISGTITTKRIEYSKNVDYSLFRVPEDYTLSSIPE